MTYTYDALDNRIGMNENSTQTWTLYDGTNPIMDFNSSGSLTTRYLWGPTGIVARQTSGGSVSWYLADHLGTVRDLINNSGAIIDHVDISAFGTVLDESSPTSGDRFVGFAMLQRDTVTGLNLAVYREENPGTGRWDSQDKAGFAAGDTDLYRYVSNGPTNASDLLGLGPQRTWTKAGRIIIDPAGRMPGPTDALILDNTDETLLHHIPKAGVFYEGDAVFFPDGVLKVPDNTTVHLYFCKDSNMWYWWYTYETTWYPYHGIHRGVPFLIYIWMPTPPPKLSPPGATNPFWTGNPLDPLDPPQNPAKITPEGPKPARQ